MPLATLHLALDPAGLASIAEEGRCWSWNIRVQVVHGPDAPVGLQLWPADHIPLGSLDVELPSREEAAPGAAAYLAARISKVRVEAEAEAMALIERLARVLALEAPRRVGVPS